MNFNLLQETLIGLGQPAFRYRQLYDFYFKNPAKSWDDVSILSKELREALALKLPLSLVEMVDYNDATDVYKFVFKMITSGELVEAVVMKHSDGRRTVCLSCQAGCPMACTFCATGTMGLKKNLTEWEMVDMVKMVNDFLREKKEAVTNVVYMGMGEPFANYLPVKKSIEILHDPKAFGLGWRKITVSTCGIVPKIAEFAKDFPQVNLAISLHAADDAKRSKLMPINDTFPLAKLMAACNEYVNITHRKLFFEYLVIDGFNDTPADVANLAKLLNRQLYHLNLIRFHETTAVENKYGTHWKAPTREKMDKFIAELRNKKINLTLRRSFGEDIDAACGMLALKQLSKNNTVEAMPKP